MKSELRSGPVYGTLPIISVFLARSGKTIHEISFVNIDNEGVARPASEAGVKSNAKGVKVVFSAGKDARKQTLYYFSTDLSDSGLKTSGFLAFCSKLGTGDSFVKSASYLMHGGNFVTVRKFLLENSALILQDDSGRPARSFRFQEMAVSAARPLSRTDRDFSRHIPAPDVRAFPEGKPDTARFRHRLSVAQE